MNPKRKKSQFPKNIGMVLLAFFILFSLVPIPAFATGGGNRTAGCTHEHDESCGGGCTFTHDHSEAEGVCGWDGENDATCSVLSTHEHDENCGHREDANCTHVCGPECGVTTVEPANGQEELRNGSSEKQIIEITGFDLLSSAIAAQIFAKDEVSQDKNELILPQTLEAKKSEEAVTVSGITWVCDEFDPAVAGEYTFTAQLPAEGFSLAVGVAMPEILVTIAEEPPVGITPFSLDFGASFQGDIDLTVADASYTTTLEDALNIGQVLQIKEKFPEVAGADKKFSIAIGQGMTLSDAPGMKADKNAGWVFDINLLEGTKYQGFITGATWVPNEKVRGQQVGAGLLTYTFASGAINIELDMKVKLDYLYRAYGQDMVLNKPESLPIKIETLIGTDVLHSACLASYTARINHTDGTWNNRFFNYGNADFIEKAARGEDIKLYANLIFKMNNLPDNYTWLNGGATFVYEVPKELNITGVYVPDTTGTQVGNFKSTVVPDKISSSLTILDDSSPFNLLTVTVAPDDCSQGRFGFWLTGKVSDTAEVGKRYDVGLSKIAITRWDGTTVEWNKKDGPQEFVLQAYHNGTNVTVLGSGEGADSFKISNGNAYVYNQEKDSPADLVPLGIFSVSNDTAQAITGRKAILEFDNPNIGVKAMFLLCGEETGPKNLKVWVNGNIVTPPNDIQVRRAERNGGYYAYLNLTDELGPNEYITRVEYEMGDVEGRASSIVFSAAMTPLDSDRFGMMFYGDLLETGGHSATITIQKKDGGGEWANEQQKELLFETVAASSPSLNIAPLGKGASLEGGNEGKEVSITFNTGTYRYADNVYCKKGFTFYVRQTKGMHVDSSSISVSWNGTTYAWADSSNKEILEDENGDTVYAFTVENELIGRGTKNLEKYPEPTLTATIQAEATHPSKDVPLSNILFGRVLEPDFAYSGYYSDRYWIGKLTLRNGSTFNVFGAEHECVVKVSANPNFSVGSSAKTTAESEWHIYRGTTATEIGLNVQLGTDYRVSLANNTGTDVYGGYLALIPIPKKDANISHTDFMAEGTIFGWSLNLTGPLEKEGAPGYTIKYATDYLTESSAPGWKSKDEIIDWTAVKMVKVEYENDIGKDDPADDVVLQLKVGHTVADAAALQGKLNVYHSRIYVDASTGMTGYIKSQPVALRLNTGIIQGNVSLDVDRSGAKNAGDTPRSGVQVSAYNVGTNVLVQSVTTDTDGNYMLAALGNTNVDLVFSNPGTGAAPMRYICSPQILENEVYTITNIKPGTNPDIAPVVKDALLQEPWTVNFKLPSKASSVASQFVWPQAKAVKPALNPVQTGYSFDNWYQDVGFTTAFDFDVVITANTTIYGQMSANDVAVSLYPMYGTNAPNTAIVKFDATLSSSLNPSREGYDFKGWYKTESGAQNLTSGEKFTKVDRDVTMNLYAGWQAKTYDVTYSNNYAGGGTFIPTNIEAKKWVFDGAKTAPSSNPSRTGYIFEGWYTSVACTEKYSFKGNYTSAGALTLYANWEAKKYDITYTLNYAGAPSFVPSNEAAKKWAFDGVKTAPNPDPSRVGYIFKGWYTNEVCTIKYTFTGNYTTDNTLTLYANWEAEKYDVSYKLNYTGAPSYVPENDAAKKWAFDGTKTAPSPSPTRTGYTLEGWYSDAECTDKYSFTGNYTTDDALTLYANWESKKYDITYNLNYTGVPSFIPTNGAAKKWAYGGVKTAPHPNPSRVGYTFEGWYTNNTCTDKYSFTGNYNNASALTLYANWEAKEYDITYSLNYTSAPGFVPINEAAKKWVFDGVKTAPTSIPTRTGYSFDGWYEDEICTTEYLFSGKYTVDGALTLYAKWKADEYDITYNLNYSGAPTFAPSNEEAKKWAHDGIKTAPNPAPNRAGYSFAGWYSNSGCTISYDFGGTFTGTTGITLYAKWIEDNFEVSLSSTGGYTFATEYKGYGAIAEHAVTVKNSGNKDIANLAVALIGTDGDKFILNKSTLNSLSVNDMDSFTITPKPNLPRGSYTATVAISGSNGVSVSYPVTFKVQEETLVGKPVALFTDEVSGMSDSQYIIRGIKQAYLTTPSGQMEPLNVPDDLKITANNVQAGPNSYTVIVQSKNSSASVNITVKVIDRLHDITFRYNNGQADQLSSSTSGALINQPNIPSYDNHTFLGWYSENKKWNFASDCMPNSSLILDARWQKDESGKPNPPSTPNPGTSNPNSSSSRPIASSEGSSESSASSSKAVVSGATSSSAASTQNGGANSSISSSLDSIKISSESKSYISDQKTPLAGLFGESIGNLGYKGVWSASNLLLIVISVIMSMFTVVTNLKNKNIRRNPIAISSLVVSIASLALFFLTSDFSKAMVFANQFTPFFLVLIGSQAISFVVSKLAVRMKKTN